MRIPLPRSPKMDEVYWHFDKKGMYTVKSGYQIALRLKYPDIPSTLEDWSFYWKAIWRLELPEKTKIFLWRATQNMLPTMENLWKKKVIASPLCQICRRSVETVSHALIECKAAGKIWKQSTLADKGIEIYKGQDMLEVWFQMSKRLCKEDLELLGATWWITWNAKNWLLFKGEKINSNVLAAKAQAIVEAYQRVKHVGISQAANQENKKQHQWTPPPTGSFKINMDAATNVEAKTTGLGAVIRDDKGRVVAAAVKPSRLRWDVPFVEAEAVELGLQVAKEAQLASIIIETDCQEVADLVNHKKWSKTEICWVISAVQDMRGDFHKVTFQHIPRCTNELAHRLAKYALKSETSNVWMDSYPEDIICIFENFA